MLQYPTIPSEDFYKIKSDPTYYLGYYPEKYWDWDACMEIMALFDDPKSFFYGNSLGEFRWEILKKYLGTIKEVLLMPGVYPRLCAPPRVYEEVSLVEVPEEPGPEPPPILAISSLTPVENNVWARYYSEYEYLIEGQGFMDEEGVEILVEIVKMYSEFRHDPVHSTAPYMRVINGSTIKVYVPKWRANYFGYIGYHDLILTTFPTAEYPEGRQALMTNAYYFWGYTIQYLYEYGDPYDLYRLGIVEGMIFEGYIKGYYWMCNFQSPYPVQEIQLENRETGELFTIPTEDWEIVGSHNINIIIRTEYA